MMVEIVKMIGVSKRYGGIVALENVDFSVQKGEVRALLGKNGAGKSTLIRLLTGAERADGGKILLSQGKTFVEYGARERVAVLKQAVRCVYQELSLVAEMSIAENMFLGAWPKNMGVINHKKMRDEAAAGLHVMGVDLDPSLTVSSLSPAECQLVEIARATIGHAKGASQGRHGEETLGCTPGLVILDEPTSSLGSDEVERVFKVVRSLQSQGTSIIYVSHRMGEIREIADRATIMRDGKAIATVDVKSVDTDDIVHMMLAPLHEPRLHEPSESKTAFVQPKNAVKQKNRVPKNKLPKTQVPKTQMLCVNHIVAGPRLNGVNFVLHEGEVLGIAGLLGSGRTELLRIIAGLDLPNSGEVVIEGHDVKAADWYSRMRLGLGFAPENRKEEGIFPLLGVDENIIASHPDRVSRAGIFSSRQVKHASQTIIDKMQIKAGGTKTPIWTLSGGNQQKIVIGRWIHAQAKILLLDEPTRGIDVEAKNQIYAIIRSLAREGKSILFISSEIEELPQLCDRVLVLKNGKITHEYHAPHIEADTLLAASMAGAD